MYFYLIGDEILSVNDESLVGLSHAEAIAVFKRIKSGDVVLTVVRRGTKYVLVSRSLSVQSAVKVENVSNISSSSIFCFFVFLID